MSVTITVNGRRHDVDVEADTPLLWVLRDALMMKGTKYGCGSGICGACTVLVGGTAVRACITSVAVVASRPVTTIEDTSSTDLAKLRAAWQADDVPQCGYCQAGQLMSATALLATHSNPTDAEISTAMRGNLCRCGTYARIRSAIHRAARSP